MARQIPILTAALIALGGCQKFEAAATGAPKPAGRYHGLGVYFAPELWGQLVRSDAPTDPQLARLDDDTQVIVVIDSTTGEVRQCGNFSGHCIAMNPWSRPAPADLPASLQKHAADLRQDGDVTVELRPADPPGK